MLNSNEKIRCECCGNLRNPSDFSMDDTCEDDIFCDFCMTISKEDQKDIDDTLLHSTGEL